MREPGLVVDCSIHYLIWLIISLGLSCLSTRQLLQMMGNLEVKRSRKQEMRERNEARGKLAVKPEGSQSFVKGRV